MQAVIVLGVGRRGREEERKARHEVSGLDHSKSYSTAIQHASLAPAALPCSRSRWRVENDASQAGHACSVAARSLSPAADAARDRLDECEAVSSSMFSLLSSILRFSDVGNGSEATSPSSLLKVSRHAKTRFIRLAYVWSILGSWVGGASNRSGGASEEQ